MFSLVKYRMEDVFDLTNEYTEFLDKKMRLTLSNFDIHLLDESNVLAVHFASAGAQGDEGGVEILYYENNKIKTFYGNFCYDDLNTDVLYSKLPMLRSLDGRRSLTIPYPFGGELEVPNGWLHAYMGYMNHFFIRKEVNDKAEDFLCAVINKTHTRFLLFNSLAWFCQAEYEKKQC